MNNDLISRSELKNEIERIKRNVEEWVNHTELDTTKALVKISLFEEFIDLIDNAPSVEQKEFEQVLQPIKVNIPEDITDKLIEELSKPRKVILDEPEITEKQAILFLINNGWLVNHDKELREKWERPHGEWIDTQNVGANNWCSVCGKFILHYDGICNYCSNCGADMRKGEEE